MAAKEDVITYSTGTSGFISLIVTLLNTYDPLHPWRIFFRCLQDVNGPLDCGLYEFLQRVRGSVEEWGGGVQDCHEGWVGSDGFVEAAWFRKLGYDDIVKLLLVFGVRVEELSSLVFGADGYADGVATL